MIQNDFIQFVEFSCQNMLMHGQHSTIFFLSLDLEVYLIIFRPWNDCETDDKCETFV